MAAKIRIVKAPNDLERRTNLLYLEWVAAEVESIVRQLDAHLAHLIELRTQTLVLAGLMLAALVAGMLWQKALLLLTIPLEALIIIRLRRIWRIVQQSRLLAERAKALHESVEHLKP